MNLETNIPKSKTPEFKESSNPLTGDAMRALAIVLGVIVVISAVVYTANFRTKSLEEVAVTPRPTVTTLTEEATLSASPSSMTSSIKEATVTPTPTR